MAKARVNFYWKGVYVTAGSEAPKDAPKSLLVGYVPTEKKASTKNGKPEKLEDK